VVVKTSSPSACLFRRVRALCAGASILTALTVAAAAQSGGTQTLTNDDVIKMVRAQLATGIILTTIDASNAKFDVSPAGLIALKDAGIPENLIQAMQAKMRTLAQGAFTDSATRSAPEKSELLADSKDPDFVLRNFKTMLVDASRAIYFGAPQMKAALATSKGFAPLNISIVDDPAVADVVLNVSYTFAWDYPFTLKHQNTSVVLLSGKGTGPFSGPAGATSVAGELVKALKPFRVAAASSTR
jgi:hypothetical protein